MNASKKTSKHNSKKATKMPVAEPEVPSTPPAHVFSEFDPRSPTVDRTPLALDPRSPSAMRTPIQSKTINPEFMDPRSPGVERTPLGEINNGGRARRGRSAKNVKKVIAFDASATAAADSLL